MTLYLDYNASAPIIRDVIDIMHKSIDITGNPSSIHSSGRKARKAIEDSRELIAETIEVNPKNIIFTSGATEANTLALSCSREMNTFISSIEHDSVLKQNINANIISVTSEGIVNLELLEKMIMESSEERIFVSIMAVNNETGVIQPIQKVSEICIRHKAILHVDAVQAIGRIDISMKKLNIDLLTISSHKIGGPKGIGCLAVSDRAYSILSPIIMGGSQERGFRGGTEAVNQIIGFGTAAKYAQKLALVETCTSRDLLEDKVISMIPNTIIVGKNAPRVANTTLIAFKNISAESLVIALDIEGYEVSSGSACSSGKVSASHVLKAMGLEENIVNGAIRISLCRCLNKSEILSFCTILKKVINKLYRKKKIMS
ncbi:MAG: cysteine desulfurase [Pelagibacterales bacterium]|nr:cysteine desulfurase [Pelagibacterales bacterium]MAU28751.1 cysteine desulfurase [Pelagibacterales bacterium]|tara:strand:- start:170 stop:1288 length:1119 start_codon:yes stop_codon:yes gene_type:complete